jgi:hypothetical protein
VARAMTALWGVAGAMTALWGVARAMTALWGVARAMTALWGVSKYLHSFLISTLPSGDRSPSELGHFIQGGRNPSTHLSRRVDLKVVKTRKSLVLSGFELRLYASPALRTVAMLGLTVPLQSNVNYR